MPEVGYLTHIIILRILWITSWRKKVCANPSYNK